VFEALSLELVGDVGEEIMWGGVNKKDGSGIYVIYLNRLFVSEGSAE
jgi:hypothetical protein